MGLVRRLKRRIADGIGVRAGSIRFELRARRVEPSETAVPGRPNIELSYARSLESKFPELQKFELGLDEATAHEILEFYTGYLPLLYPPAHGAHLRTLLCRLRSATKNVLLKRAATQAIAISDIADGMPDRALCLRGDPKHGRTWQAQANELEMAYGAALVSEDWGQASRGSSLVFYFEAHEELLHGKDILHFGPEPELLTWITRRKPELGIGRYLKVDGIQPKFDELHDITDINLPDQSFDVIICHRVMEHVCDDRKGFSELFRILRPGGLLNFSVPQASHRVTTAEWLIPDESHHGHVRHYGSDLEQRLGEAGFYVVQEPWLLAQRSNELRARQAYPLRMYNARRPPKA